MMDYRDVNIEDMHQQRDIFRWQGMSNSLAYLKARNATIDDYRHWEKVVDLEADMGIYGSAVDDITMTDKANEDDVVDKVYSILDGQELALVTETYLNGESLKAMGKRYGVKESRACQIRSDAIKKIRKRMRIT